MHRHRPPRCATSRPDAARVSTNGASSNGHGTTTAVATAPVASATGRPLIGDLLVHHETITREQLEEALLAQTASGVRLGEILLAGSDRRPSARRGSRQPVPTSDRKPPADRPDADALSALSESVARGLQVVPMMRIDGVLHVVVADPARPGLREELEKVTKSKVALVVAAPSDVRMVIDQSYRALAGVAEHIKEFEVTSPARVTEEAVTTAVDVNAPVVQVVNRIITQALRDRASDVHIEPQDDQVRVRVPHRRRAARRRSTLPAEMGPALVSRIKIMAGMNIVERRRRRTASSRSTVDGRALDVRVATTATIWGEKVVLRLLDKSRSLFQLGDLGMPDDTPRRSSRARALAVRHGALRRPDRQRQDHDALRVAQRDQHDRAQHHDDRGPGRVRLPVGQPDPDQRAGRLTFAAGLKSILRQDPDVILVGEIRDVETARIAVQSALTGHFVLSSLHATDAASALHRFLDMGIESFLIASSVLARRRPAPRAPDLHATARTPYEPTADELAFYESSRRQPKSDVLPRRGLQLLRRHRLPRPHRRLRAAAHHRRDARAHRRRTRRTTSSATWPSHEGMRTLRDEALRLVEDDVTTIAEVLRTSTRSYESRRKAQCRSSTTPALTADGPAVNGDGRRPTTLTTPRVDCSRSASLDVLTGQGAEELRQDRDHAEEGQAAGDHELLAAAGGVPPAGIPISTRSTCSRRDRRTSGSGECSSRSPRRCAAARPFSSAIAAHAEVLPDFYIGILRSAELTGNLDAVLDQLADYIERDSRPRARRSSRRSTYPPSILVMAIVAVIVLVAFVLPRFKDVLRELRRQAAAADADAARRSPTSSRLLVVVAARRLVVVRRRRDGCTCARTEGGQCRRDRFLLRAARRRRRSCSYAVVERFCRILALDDQGRRADARGDGSRSRRHEQPRLPGERSSEAREAMMRGEGMAGPIAATDLFPGGVRQMIRVGEDTGTLDDQLETAAGFYGKELEYKLKRLTALFEPPSSWSWV